jgi:DNA-binding HxlR family transcriptional regulator
MKIQTRRYDLYDENVDEYFFQAIDNMTPEQKERLPNELAAKVRRGAKESLDTLTFVQKLHILTSVLGKKWTLIIEDEAGISYEAFLSLQKGYTENHPRLQAVSELRESGSFYIGAPHLMKRLEYVALQCATTVYKAIKGYRSEIHERRKKIAAQREISESVRGVFRLLMHYEANKYKLNATYGLESVSEWLALMYFYDNEEKPSQFNDMFMYAYSSGKRNRGQALLRLRTLGYIDTRAKKHSVHTKYYLTPKGKELAIKIMERVFMNY